MGCGAETCPEVVCEDIVYVGLEPPIEGTYQVELMTEAGTFSFSCSEGVVDGDGAVACDQDGFHHPDALSGVAGSSRCLGQSIDLMNFYHEVRAGGAECPFFAFMLNSTWSCNDAPSLRCTDSR